VPQDSRLPSGGQKPHTMNITIIGGGNLGTAIALGIVRHTQGNQVTLTRRNTRAIAHLSREGIHISDHNLTAIDSAEVVILCVKPWQTEAVIQEIQPSLDGKVLASAVSGVSLEQLQLWAGIGTSVMRVMPNIAVQFGESATCLSFAEAHKTSIQPVSALFGQLGTAVVIDEKLMDAATVLGACGTAYALRYIRASMQAGIEIGFDAQTALAIAAQTAKGAAKMALEEQVHPEQLIDRVTTPQGCTIVGLNEMEHQGFSSALIQGIKTSLKKIRE
jgi:pyrroline-5-carboxylate reductase